MPFVASLIQRLRGSLGRRLITLDELEQHLVNHTAAISHKATWDYVRARLGVSWPQLFALPELRDALEICRWEAYAAVLADVAEVTQILLRRAGAPEPPLAGVLVAMAERALVRHPVPSHRRNWNDVTESLRRRLERAALAPPKPVRLLGSLAARRVIEVLPVDDSLKREDSDFIENNIRFLLVRYYEDSERLVDLPAVVAAIRTGGRANGGGAAGEDVDAGPTA